jgi:hypothetical protein
MMSSDSVAKCIPRSWVVAEPIVWYRRCHPALRGVVDESSRGRHQRDEIFYRKLVLGCEGVVYKNDH